LKNIRIGCCTSAFTRFMPLDKAIENIAALGFKSVEINVDDLAYFPSAMTGEYKNRLVRILNENSLCLNIHIDLNYISAYSCSIRKPFNETAKELVLPFFSWAGKTNLKMITFDPLYTRPFVKSSGYLKTGVCDSLYYTVSKIRRGLYGYLSRNIKPISDLKLVHGIFNGKLTFYRAATIDIIKFAASACKEIPVGIENFSEGTCTPENFEDIQKELNGEFGVLLDIGHANLNIQRGLTKEKSIYDYICAFKTPIIDIHASDNDGLYDQHLPPMQGSIDYYGVVSGLERTGYNGSIMLEVEGKTLERIKNSLSTSKNCLENMIN